MIGQWLEQRRGKLLAATVELPLETAGVGQAGDPNAPVSAARLDDDQPVPLEPPQKTAQGIRVQDPVARAAAGRRPRARPHLPEDA